jgi:anti-anti-sigma regulatory factor
MVFSLFKKSQEKMPERQVARPKQTAQPAAEELAPAAKAPGADAGASPEQSGKEELPVLDFTESQFSDLSVSSIEVEHDIDPIQADIEQAAVLFANGQDSAARSVLELSARSHTGANAERLWRMLLDLMQVLGDRTAFDKLGMEFAEACEKSPPTWRVEDKAQTCAASGETVLVMQGVITGNDAPEIGKLQEFLAAKRPVRVDLGKLASCDNDAAGALCDLLRLARKQGIQLTLDGADGVVGRLGSRLVVGQPESPSAWLLLLELYQRLGQQEVFEEKAVDYAVTFEVSPPSWEIIKQPAAKPGTAPAATPPKDEALFLSGELKNYRFGELPEYLGAHDQPIIDFSRVKRLDFFSAGLLRNSLEPFRRDGKEIVIRNPHHLVAELMGIVGLDGVARIVVPKF